MSLREFAFSLTGCNEDDKRQWDELCPDGARRFYEAHDPEAFRQQMIDLFGFDPAADDPDYPAGSWSEARGWAFSIPAGLVGEVYGRGR